MAPVDYWTHGMSEYAVNAYTSGLVPGSKVKGIPVSLIRKFCEPRETHVSSKNFNKVPFYSPNEVRAIFGLAKNQRVRPNPRAVEALARWKEERKKPPPYRAYQPCAVQWVEYLGRTHAPQAILKTARGAKVEVDGRIATVTLGDGTRVKKRLSSKGFRFWPEKAESAQLSLFAAAQKGASPAKA